MAKHKLTFDEEYDFQLIGICSSHSDYRLCWSINNSLSIGLNKEEDYSVIEKKQGEHLHSFYSYYDEEEHIEYYLIKNLSNNYQRLIPEKDQIDYFLVIKNNYVREINDILNQLKQIEVILTAFIFEPDELKSKSNLVF
ncbi:IPExxxVDY family protein [Paracrocinitomix mangrovi]|uniref:IPExxxVDY family protein n=1 Tax=Paracrocinitomix mangrovi TaxID=2862509 RepID=UPI001C8D6DE1|nr:IPExxxVDY family protein [Paracrocinitomix mangrovi]UKN00863.1 IPExxxVDY family protein [Paracrocinitomix mangrovi]